MQSEHISARYVEHLIQLYRDDLEEFRYTINALTSLTGPLSKLANFGEDVNELLEGIYQDTANGRCVAAEEKLGFIYLFKAEI